MFSLFCVFPFSLGEKKGNHKRVTSVPVKRPGWEYLVLKETRCGYRYSVVAPFDPWRLLFGGAEGLEAVADCLTRGTEEFLGSVDAYSMARLRAGVQLLSAFRNNRA